MSKLLRLFVGIFPSPSTQEQLHKKAKNLSQSLQTQVRLLAPEVLHLTVKFIGNVDESSPTQYYARSQIKNYYS